ncbi:MAG: DUF4388 domain-containing protein [Terriglobia bacterium]
MSIVGSLATMNVADLLQFLEVGHKSGILKVSHENITKMIYFQNGIIAGSSSNDPKEYFGQFLLHYGKIDESGLKAGMECHRQMKVPLGRALVHLGQIKENDMMELLRERALEIIYELFLWEHADFAFEDNATLPDDLIRIEIKPTSVVMEGIYRVDEWQRYRSRIPSDRVVLGLVPGHRLQDATGGTHLPKILWYIKKQMTVGEICYNLHASPFHVYSLLYGLLSDGVVQVVEELPVRELPPLPLPHDLEALDDLLARAKKLIEHQQAAEAVDLLSNFLELDPNHTEAKAILATAESVLVQEIFRSGIRPEAIPVLAVSIDRLTTTELGPKEGFILSRINASWDVKSILSICPFREADCLRILQRLYSSKLIRFTAPAR